jgi:hypothetical protein
MIPYLCRRGFANLPRAAAGRMPTRADLSTVDGQAGS